MKDYTLAVFDRHVECILGDECYLLGEANPAMACGPTWDLLMKCEYEVRTYAVRKVNEGGATIAEAMAMARDSVEHRAKFFVTPLAMPSARVSTPRPAVEQRGAKRPAEDAPAAVEGGPARQPGAGKGKSKGKSKSKSSSKEATVEHVKNLSDKAAYKIMRNSPNAFGAKCRGPDGVPRCHNFQVGKCAEAGCKFTHACLRCGGNHGVTRCPEMGLDKR